MTSLMTAHTPQYLAEWMGRNVRLGADLTLTCYECGDEVSFQQAPQKSIRCSCGRYLLEYTA